jgi:hypothetical protein
MLKVPVMIPVMIVIVFGLSRHPPLVFRPRPALIGLRHGPSGGQASQTPQRDNSKK